MSILQINSNGSKWAGEKPDGIKELQTALQNYTLDPTFEKYGNFIFEYKPIKWTDNNKHLKGCTSFFGNFMTYSHVFNIVTDDKEIIEQLTKLIRQNQQTEEYKAYKKRMLEVEEVNKSLPYSKRIMSFA